MTLVLAAIGLVVAQAIDGLLTATGPMFLDIALSVPLLGRRGLAVGFSLVFQATTVAADLVLASVAGLQRSSVMFAAVLLATVAWCGTQGTVAFLHFTQLTNLTRGGQLTQSLPYAADVLPGASPPRILRYRWRTAQRVMEAQSRAGDDQRRIAACGPRCQNAINTRRQIETRYAVLATDLLLLVTSAPMVAYAQPAPLIDGLKIKSEQYLEMCRMIYIIKPAEIQPT